MAFMGLLPSIIALSFIMIFMIFICIVLLIIKKIGMTFLAKKLKISSFGLLWIPFLGSLYEGKLMNKFLKYGKGFEIAYFYIMTIIKAIWLINFFFGPRYNDPSFDTINSIIGDVASIIILIDIVFKSITLKKSGYKTFVSAMISIFLQPFWCYFASNKIKKYS